MRSFSITAAAFVAIASTAQASNFVIKNYCSKSMYLGFANATNTDTDRVLPAGLAFVSPIEGENNKVVITNQPGQYWLAGGWKADFGYTTKEGTLWWSLAEEYGDPISPGEFNVTSSGSKDDVCGHVTDYTSGVKQCPDDGVTLAFNLCSNNQ